MPLLIAAYFIYFMEKCDESGLGFWENGSRDVRLEKGDISEW